jgi:hypothetical protein
MSVICTSSWPSHKISDYIIWSQDQKWRYTRCWLAIVRSHTGSDPSTQHLHMYEVHLYSWGRNVLPTLIQINLFITVRLRNLIRGGLGPTWAGAPLNNNNREAWSYFRLFKDFYMFWNGASSFDERRGLTTAGHPPLRGGGTRAGTLELNSVVLVRERTIPTERPPLVGEVSANFCW